VKLRLNCLLHAAGLGLSLHLPSAGATSLCRWVDEHGQTQFAQVVPDRYSKVAVCTDSAQYELSPEQTRAAAQQAAQGRAQARKDAAKAPGQSPARASNSASAPTKPVVKLPVERITASTDCTTWWRIYDESVECFGPYRTTRGAIQQEGFEMCNVVASPESKCGPRSR
jgi:hypothetical protein